MQAVPYRELSYAGLILWGAVLCFFVYWKISKWYLLKKPIKIPQEIGLENKEEFLNRQRKFYNRASRGLRRILIISGFALAADSVIISILASFGLDSGYQFVLPSIILTTSLIPGFFLLMLLSAVMKEYIKRLDENDCVLEPAAKVEAEKIWLMNLLPLLALVLFYQGKINILYELGFGAGLAMAVIVLSLVFFIWKEPVGLGVNVILLGFVFISYLAPQFELSRANALEQNAWSFIGVYAIQLFPILAIDLGVAQLTKYPLIERVGVLSPGMPKIVSHYLNIPVWVAVFTPLIGITLQAKMILPYSLSVVCLQALAWWAVLVFLSISGRRGRLDFGAIGDYLKKNKNYRLPFDWTFLSLVLMALLLLSAAFETYRGLWLFFGGVIIWASFICLSLWQIWKYAFPK